MPFSNENRSNTFSGILFVMLFALSSCYIAEMPLLIQSGISSLVIAIILGIIYSNTLRHRLPTEWNPGIQFAAKKLLRLAIILYGFRISFQQIASVGIAGLIIDVIVVSTTIILGYIIGVKIFKLDKHLALLISSGAAICGAAAVLAVEDVLKSEAYKATVAVGTVVLFGTLAMFLFPMLQHAGLFGLTENQFGIFAGASIHEVAQALVAGENIGPEAGNVAVIIKMTRVLLLVPILLLLSFFAARLKITSHEKQKIHINIPWFAIGFIIMIGFNSLHLLSLHIVKLINQIDAFLLTMAMAAIGIETNLTKIKKVGFGPLYLATILFFWLLSSVWMMLNFM